MTAEDLWYAWHGRDWRPDAQWFAIPPGQRPYPPSHLAHLAEVSTLEEDTDPRYPPGLSGALEMYADELFADLLEE